MIVSLTIFFVTVFLGYALPAFGDARFWDSTYAKSEENEAIPPIPRMFWFCVSELILFAGGRVVRD